jgi:hypothetical protein
VKYSIDKNRKTNMLSKLIFVTGLIISTGAYAMTSISTPVPEPESLSLIAIGLGLIGLIVLRKR